jgi:hypothetical protein
VCWCYAEYKILGRVQPPLNPKLTKTEQANVFEEFKKQFRTFANFTSDQRSQIVADWGVGFVEALMNDTPAMEKAMEALLFSVLIASWSAFETLVGDLWVAAIDFGPKELQNRLLLASNKWQKPDDAIGAATLGDIEHSPKKHFGSVLKAARKVSFQKLQYVIRYYDIAFATDTEALFKDTENGHIYALAALRHIFVHNAGKPDATFFKQIHQAKGLDDLKKATKGKSIHLDGELVNNLRHAAMMLGSRLIHFVDDVLTPLQPDVANTTSLESD